MAWVKAKNPASSLMLINPQRGKKMAVRRRRKTATNTRRRTTAAVNPRRRRRNRTTIYTAATRRTNRRRSNPPRRRRRRNPQVKTLIVGSLYAAAGAMAQGIIAGFIPIKAQGLMGIGVELGVAYVTAMVGERVLGAGPNAQFFAVGAAAGVGKSILNYVFGLAQSGVGALTSAAQPKALPEGGVNDIVAWDGMRGLNDMGDIVPYAS